MEVMSVWDVLKSPIITEKSVLLKEQSMGDDEGQVLSFKVSKKASKHDIRRAIEEIFGVKVDKVHTINYKGKIKRQGKYSGRRPSWKKAYVTLKAGETPVDYSEAI
ncbi:MAG: 50S ribosomal protein L23 [Pyrinomonadaceae bacterium]